MKAEVKQLDYYVRSCEVCGGSDSEEVLNFTKMMHNNIYSLFEFKMNFVVCKNCGFAYCNPCPTQESLNRYYSNSLSTFVGQESYSVERRMEIINALYHKGMNTFLEIGSNENSAFNKELKSLFEKIVTVEVNASCDSNFSDLESVVGMSEQADIIAMYYVLEHIPDVNRTLSIASSALLDGGAVIIEVPNIYEYTYDITGFNYAEHINHFSPHTLTAVAEKHGLELCILSKQKCSRDVGFVAAFTKNGRKRDYINRTEYLYALDNLISANRQVQALNINIRKIVDSIHDWKERGLRVVLWCASFLSEPIVVEYLNTYGQFPCEIVDSDVRKKEYFQCFSNDINVSSPEDAAYKISQADIFVVCTYSHHHQIVDNINELREQSGNSENTLMVYYVDNKYNLHEYHNS